MKTTRRLFVAGFGTAAARSWSACAAQAERIGKTGFIHVEKRSGVWWFVSAEGKPFVSMGVNHVEPHLWLGPYNRQATLGRYGADFVTSAGEFNPQGQAARRWMDNVLGIVERLGFNSLGKHTHPLIPSRLYSQRIYYIASMETAPVASWRQKQNEGPFPDVFSPQFERHLTDRVAAVCHEHAPNKKLLGYLYVDLPWWVLHEGDQRAMNQRVMIHPWVNEILRMNADAPGKQKWIELLRSRHASPAEAARVFGLKAATWEEMAQVTDWFSPAVPEPARAATQEFVIAIAERWYRLHHDQIRRRDPNHLILGDKMQPPPEWLQRVAAKYVDVNVLQWRGLWTRQVKPIADQWHRTTGKPVLMGDSTFSFRRPQQQENGVKGWQEGIHNYQEMAQAYAQFVEEAFPEPYLIGWHHCGFIEQWDGSERGDVATNENGLIDPFEKIDPAVQAAVPQANRQAASVHAKGRAT